MALLTNEEKRRIEERIAEAEKKTSGEIVAVFQPSSGRYAWSYFAWATLGLVGVSVPVAVFSFTAWGLSATQLLEWQVLGTAAGLFISLVRPCRRLFISRRAATAKVHREALAHFVLGGMVETRDRTGILLYLSEFERRVEIVADKGIHSKVGTGYWDEQTRSIVAGIRQGKAAEALCEAIDRIGQKLADNFPPRPDDTNEIPNTVRS